MTNKGLIKEFKPLTIPKPKIKSSRTIWRNHFFTKKPEHLINKINKEKNRLCNLKTNIITRMFLKFL